MKLGVFGSRSLKGDVVKMLIIDEVRACGADTIVTAQEPLGVCTLAQQVAKELTNATDKDVLVLELHFLNWRRQAGAYRHRSQEVIDTSDKILLIHDGASQGTFNELEQVKASGKPFRYVILPVDEQAKPLDTRLDTFQSYHEKDAQKPVDTSRRDALIARLKAKDF